jgi:hypothetical protein
VLQACGARVHLAHPLGVKGFRYRRVKNDVRDAGDLAPKRKSKLTGDTVAAIRRLREGGASYRAAPSPRPPGCRREVSATLSSLPTPTLKRVATGF